MFVATKTIYQTTMQLSFCSFSEMIYIIWITKYSKKIVYKEVHKMSNKKTVEYLDNPIINNQ